jgi:cysteine desulfurase
MDEGFRIWANPSSPHAEGRKAKAALEDARERIKASLGWNGELIFTSGASEALAIGLGRAKVDCRIVSAAEHDAVFRGAPDAQILPITNGGADIGELDRLLAGEGKPLVAIQQLNSETGTFLLPAGETSILERVHSAGGWLLSDCAQSAGKFALPDADMIVVAPHKFGGPIGIGILLVRDFAMLEPTGGHERGYRAGTENMPAAYGVAAALECGGMESWATTAEQQAEFRRALSENGQVLHEGEQAPHILALVHHNISAQALLIRLDAMGFAVSAGSACSSGTLKKSRVLDAFGIDDDMASRTIRVSLGWSTTPEELEKFAESWASLK